MNVYIPGRAADVHDFDSWAFGRMDGAQATASFAHESHRLASTGADFGDRREFGATPNYEPACPGQPIRAATFDDFVERFPQRVHSINLGSTMSTD